MCRGYAGCNERPQERPNPDISRESDAIIWTEMPSNHPKGFYSAYPKAPLLEKNPLASAPNPYMDFLQTIHV